MSTGEFELPSIPLVRQKLSGVDNYEAWKISILHLAEMLELDGILNGSITKPITTPGLSSTPSIHNNETEWKAANARLALMIEYNCEDGPRSVIAALDTSAAMWAALENRYKDRTGCHILFLFTQVITHKHDTRNESLEDHIRNFELRWDRLSTACVGTHADDTTEYALQKFTASDQLKACIFMTTLPPSFNKVLEVLRVTPNLSYDRIITCIRDAQANRQIPKCNWCKVNRGWSGIGHWESECRQKRQAEREKQQNQEPVFYEEEDWSTHTEVV